MNNQNDYECSMCIQYTIQPIQTDSFIRCTGTLTFTQDRKMKTNRVYVSFPFVHNLNIALIQSNDKYSHSQSQAHNTLI